MHEYHPPLARRTGMRLDFNENTDGCSARVLAQIRAMSADDLARYPER
jgi:histidinol-phosphate aminotransferase